MRARRNDVALVDVRYVVSIVTLTSWVGPGAVAAAAGRADETRSEHGRERRWGQANHLSRSVEDRYPSVTSGAGAGRPATIASSALP